MFFGYFQRARATSEALAAVRPLVATMAIRGPIPVEALLDPYVIGFIAMTVTFHVARSNRGNLDILGLVLLAVYKDIAGSNFQIVADSAIECANRKDAEYMRGQREADRICCLLYGLEISPTGSIILATPDPIAAQSIIQSSFFEHINRKFRKAQ